MPFEMKHAIMRYVRRAYHLFKVDKLRSLFNDIEVERTVPVVRANYVRVLDRLRRKANDSSERIRILFVCGDSTKWKVESVYKLLSASDRYDVAIVVTLYGWHDDLAEAERRASATYEYFKEKGKRVELGYSISHHKPIPLSSFRPDVVFYDQPWDIFNCHMPNVVSRYALTCYVAYMVPNLEISRNHVATSFHRCLFRHFTLNDEWTALAMNARQRFCASAAGDFFATGHPMLDWLGNDDFGLSGNESIVIYAPHWAFHHKDNPNSLDISTFLWTGKPMLDYARKHNEVNWAFKPHPVLKGMLIKSGVMTVDEVESYYNEWAAIGECCYSGDYPDLFRRSYAMVTDCSSFLSEYACTGKPLVRLVSPCEKVKFCELSKPLMDTYYQVRSPEELEPMLDKIVVRREDPNREARQAAAKAMNLIGVDAAGNIVSHLEELIWGHY